MSEQILITGGSGLVGRHLTGKLLQLGYQVAWLSQSGKTMDNVNVCHWNVDKGEIDDDVIDNADYIIHLAGEGIADKRWSKQQKNNILESRVKSAELIKRSIEKNGKKTKAFISASGIGYYGYDNGGVWLKETSRFGDDFVAKVVKEWEASADKIGALGVRTVKLRTGIVLSKNGGALAKMTPPVKMGLGAPLGSGEQFMSWIHIDDLCAMYLHAIKNEAIAGTYNAVAQKPVTNREFNKTLAEVLGKPYFMPRIPAFVLKLILGEMASLVLGSCRVSNEKAIADGFQFEHVDLGNALDNILVRS